MGLCRVWGGRGAYIGLVGRLEVKKPRGRWAHLGGCINMDLKKCGTVWNRFDSR
jgi:hypothetical protein